QEYFAVLPQAPDFARADVEDLAAAVRHGHHVRLLAVAILETGARVAEGRDGDGARLLVIDRVIAVKAAHYRRVLGHLGLWLAGEKLVPAGQRIGRFLIELEELHFLGRAGEVQTPGLGCRPITTAAQAEKPAILQ